MSELMPKSKSKFEFTFPGYTLEALVDDDGHLNIYVGSRDGSGLVEVDAVNDGHYRFSTEKIEERA